MARKPDTPCAGCGKLLYSTATSLPAGVRMCHACRRAKRTDTRDCRICGKPFTPFDHRDRQQLTCSRTCGSKARIASGWRVDQWPPHPCKTCGTVITRACHWCGDCAKESRLARWQRKNLRRRADGDELMSIRELADRDGWRCHLCKRRVAKRLRWPHPMSASRDHLVPVADGGTNEPSNLALAHLRCNVARGTDGGVQLRLVG